MSDSSVKRKPPRWGVWNISQAFCVCGWRGVFWYYKRSINARSELRQHRLTCVVKGKT
jgi:hypothetical protein